MDVTKYFGGKLVLISPQSVIEMLYLGEFDSVQGLVDVLMKNIYDPQFVSSLFDEMSKTYGRVNLITSFGFSYLWRKQFVKLANIRHGDVVYDLMTGAGECWQHIMDDIGTEGAIYALDLSPQMVRKAESNKDRLQLTNVDLQCRDVLKNGIPDHSADAITAGFGLKTLSGGQLEVLAKEVTRILKPGARFALMDISVPPNRLIRLPYLLYISIIIPLIGKILLGNPDNYRMLGTYTKKFGDVSRFGKMLENTQQLEVHYQAFFFGCMTCVYGQKRDNDRE